MDASPFICIVRLALKVQIKIVGNVQEGAWSWVSLEPVCCLSDWQPRTWLLAQTYMYVDDKVQAQVGVSYTNSALYKDHRVLEVPAMESHALWSLCQASVGEAQYRLCEVLNKNAIPIYTF